MYINGHEHKNVVEYWRRFVEHWKEYEKCFVIYGNDGNVLSIPTGFAVPQGVHFWLILVTHDESIFYENDCRKIHWTPKDAKAITEEKVEVQSIMVSKFLTSKWGWLVYGEE
jgi:hypothetical protein